MDVTSRTYGDLAIKDGIWWLRTEPHVTIRVKRLFPKMSPNAQGVLWVSDTLDTCRDLGWMLTRWPLRMRPADRDYLDSRVDKAVNLEASVREIQGGLRLGADDWMVPATVPRDYQLSAADLALATGRLIVVHGLGMGKTLSALLVLRDPKARPAVAVTLGGIMPDQWTRQVHEHFPQLTAEIAPRGEITDRVQQRLLDADVVVVPYSRLAKYEPVLRGHVKTAIFDEVQELRHEGTAKYNAAASIAGEADYRIGVTGTLIYGYAGETWDIAEVHEPGVLGTKTEFTREWGAVAARTGSEVSIADAGPLGAYMREIGLMDVKSKKDVGLPYDEPDVQQFHIDVDPDIIDAASRDLTEIAEKLLEGGGTRQEQFGWEREMDWRMRQATGLAKAVPVAELVKLMLESERRVLMFGWHHDVYDVWGRELAKYYPVKFTGQESEVRKAANIRAFTTDRGETRVCMMSVRAGAGIDGLQKHCAALVIGELDWSPGVHQQNIGRLDRPGQPRPVFGYIATTDYGSDPAITEVLGLKRREERSLAGVSLGTEPSMSNGDRIRLLAEAVLNRRGVL